jgi:exodeoxyribonuclease VII small subunit
MPIKKTTTFEEAMSRLDEIVARLDGGEASLEESLALFSEGAELMTFCEKKLADAKLTIEKLFPEEAE